MAALLWEGRLPAATPAQVLAASPALRKNFVEKLRTKRVETAAITATMPSPAQLPSEEPASHNIFKLDTPHQAAFSLPLQEVKVLVNKFSTENAVLNQGSQIVVIRADVAQACGAQLNTQHRIQMEGANGIRTWTLGCAEDLSLKIGVLSFVIHAHVLEGAPFRLLLGQPFYNLLLCKTEDCPDGGVNLTLHDPANPSRIFVVKTQPRCSQPVPTAETFMWATVPSLPGTAAYTTDAACAVSGFLTPPIQDVLMYKKVANKVRPVPTTLPERYRVVRRRPEDPLLSLPVLPTHPPCFTPGTRLTAEQLDKLQLNKDGFLWPDELRLLHHVL